MATFRIDVGIDPTTGLKEQYYTDVGSGGSHDATEWQICKDKQFPEHLIIDQALITLADIAADNTLSLMEWSTPLPKLQSDKINPAEDEYYEDLTEYYLRVRLYVNYAMGQDASISPWVVVGPFNQLDQTIAVTQDLKLIAETTAEDLGWVPKKTI